MRPVKRSKWAPWVLLLGGVAACHQEAAPRDASANLVEHEDVPANEAWRGQERRSIETPSSERPQSLVAIATSASAETSTTIERAATTPASPRHDAPRIGALGPHTWIWREPARTGLAIGKMRIGTSVALKSSTPVQGTDCDGRWYAVEPRGYVCDDNTATLDLEDPYFKVLEFSVPTDGHWPYRYAHSNGAPMYGRVPQPDEWASTERGMGPIHTPATLGDWARGHEELILKEPIEATDEVPYFLRDGKRSAPGGNYDTRALVWRHIPAGSMVAYSRAFEVHGRVWLLTPDSMVVPADRVSALRRSEFRGVYFAESDLRLPFAWNRSKTPIELYRKDASGAFVLAGETVPPKSPVEIHERGRNVEPWVYYELRKSPGIYIRRDARPEKALDGSVVTTHAVTERPKGVAENERWIDVRIISGTLTAYEGLRPVMTTLFSPGKGGPPRNDFKFPNDHAKYATTALGRFPVEWKEAVATMSSEKGEPRINWFTDVPNQQYLKAPLAMHVTYWHEDFGKRKSAECVNVSPRDGDWLFDWTLPHLPDGWNAIRPGSGNGPSTPIIVTAR